MTNNIWDTAPDWAMWIATDSDGTRWVFEDKPRYSDNLGFWNTWDDGGKAEIFDNDGDPATWRESLYQRPGVYELEQLRARVVELEATLAAFVEVTTDLADDLEAEVNGRYIPPGGELHSALKVKYERDMRPVHEARSLLAKVKAT